MAESPPRAPWERLAAESPPAFEAFAAYRDMGLGRSHVKVARKLGKSSTVVSGWSKRHRWVERVAAYDAFLDRLHLDNLTAQKLEIRERHMAIAQHFQVAISKKLAALSDAEWAQLSIRDLSLLAQRAVNIESRAAFGYEVDLDRGERSSVATLAESLRELRGTEPYEAARARFLSEQKDADSDDDADGGV